MKKVKLRGSNFQRVCLNTLLLRGRTSACMLVWCQSLGSLCYPLLSASFKDWEHWPPAAPSRRMPWTHKGLSQRASCHHSWRGQGHRTSGHLEQWGDNLMQAPGVIGRGRGFEMGQPGKNPIKCFSKSRLSASKPSPIHQSSNSIKNGNETVWIRFPYVLFYMILGAKPQA